MPRQLLLSTLVTLVLLSPAVLANTVYGAAADTLLPAELGAWQQTAWERVEAPELERLGTIPGGAALLREYGCRRAERAWYRSGDLEGRVTVFEMADRSGAYGAFTLLGAPTGLLTERRIALGEAGIAGVDAALFYQGNYLVNTWGSTPARESLEHLRRLGGAQASLPTLPDYLPREGFVAGSDRYLLGPVALNLVAPLAEGDWAGFVYGAEAEAARYRVGGEEATLVLVSYPTPQIAAARLRDFEQLFNLNGAGDSRRRPVYAKRSGTLVVVVAGIESQQTAERLLDQVRYETEISWSRPAKPRPQIDWVLTIFNILVGTGLLLLFALLSGVAFGVVRLLVKRVLPGKVFDRPEDTEIIQLNLNFRP